MSSYSFYVDVSHAALLSYDGDGIQLRTQSEGAVLMILGTVFSTQQTVTPHPITTPYRHSLSSHSLTTLSQLTSYSSEFTFFPHIYSLLRTDGQPLNEPIAARGPFVMNTESELRQAMMDYQNGKMGRGIKG